MREILFRGKSKSNGWVEGLYLTYDPKIYDCLENPSHVIVNNPKAIGCGLCIQESEMEGENLEVYSDTIGQFTGLTDKNGKKIFEGDIVRAILPATRVLSEYTWPPQLVTFCDGAFGLEHNKIFTPLRSFVPSVQLEIIGNIHDKPELMEDE